MKFYSVYKKSKDLVEECILVKRGFSWASFFFGVLWALYKKLWDLVLIHILVLLVGKLAVMAYPSLSMYVITIILALQIIIAFYANNLLESKLARDGYKKIDLVAGYNEESALLRFFSNIKKS